MPKYTFAYTDLISRLDEINTILSQAKKLGRQTPTPLNLKLINALCRGGVVLLCSHIEGYIEDLGLCCLDRIAQRQVQKDALGNSFRYYLSRDFIERIKDTDDKSKISLTIDAFFARDGHLWDGSPNFTSQLSADIFISNFSNPTHDKINKFFNRFGFDEYTKKLGQHLTRDYEPCSAMINNITDQRNKIAHGDANINASPSDLQNMVLLAKKYCRGTDVVVANWFKYINCSIR